MSENPSPTAALDRWIANWLVHQRALGRGYNREEWVLKHLRRFVETIPAPDLDQSGFDRWCDASRHLSATTRRGQQLIVRKFCLYRQRTEPKAGAGWAVCFSGKTRGRWRSPEAAARAVAQHQTGFPEWDREYLPVPEDIIDWRPLGKSI